MVAFDNIYGARFNFLAYIIGLMVYDMMWNDFEDCVIRDRNDCSYAKCV